MTPGQPSLFEPGPALPAGFRYGAGLISPDQERDLLERLAGLPFALFEFRGLSASAASSPLAGRTTSTL